MPVNMKPTNTHMPVYMKPTNTTTQVHMRAPGSCMHLLGDGNLGATALEQLLNDLDQYIL
jgi:hypothetical protein